MASLTFDMPPLIGNLQSKQVISALRGERWRLSHRHWLCPWCCLSQKSAITKIRQIRRLPEHKASYVFVRFAGKLLLNMPE